MNSRQAEVDIEAEANFAYSRLLQKANIPAIQEVLVLRGITHRNLERVVDCACRNFAADGDLQNVQKLVEGFPSFQHLRRHLGVVYELHGDKEEAENVWREILHTEGGLRQCIGASDVLFGQGEMQGSENLWEQILREHSDSIEVLKERVRCLKREKRFHELLSSWKNIIQQKPSMIPGCITYAQELMDNSEQNTSLLLWQVLLDHDSSYSKQFRRFICRACEKYSSENALDLISRAQRMCPLSDPGELVKSIFKRQDLDLVDVFQRYEAFRDFCIRTVITSYQTNRLEALENLRKMSCIAPEHLGVRLAYGRTLVDAGEPIKAVELWHPVSLANFSACKEFVDYLDAKQHRTQALDLYSRMVNALPSNIQNFAISKVPDSMDMKLALHMFDSRLKNNPPAAVHFAQCIVKEGGSPYTVFGLIQDSLPYPQQTCIAEHQLMALNTLKDLIALYPLKEFEEALDNSQKAFANRGISTKEGEIGN